MRIHVCEGFLYPAHLAIEQGELGQLDFMFLCVLLCAYTRTDLKKDKRKTGKYYSKA